ncbi:hypothetical protein [Chryseosolibacter indicus]|uniref:Lipoprotein n=1 Tax=Chryseosolibacter indicus TaxID=2782351 RepID=A0ABS5VX35_9BACT|nr:hypothetical protein [Chryseosolibacter indicus]MBT1705969.1 hypothetical protein [Chryseosolibacter indicus]
MKITRFLLLSAVLFFAFSCSDDDEPKSQEQELEEATLSLNSSSNVITAPSAMLSSDDTYAQMAAAWVQSANAMSQYLEMMVIPQGATKSSTRITASNGRSAESGEVLTYTWSHPQGGSYAYQVSNTSTKYVFEMFIKATGSASWVKYFHAEELKDRSEGYMKVFDAYGMTDKPGNALLQYSWKRNGDNFKMLIDDYTGAFVIELNLNVKTKAGNVIYIIEGSKTYEMIWDAKGNGGWKWFDTDGSILEQGQWEV